jgi:hypothetical protein
MPTYKALGSWDGSSRIKDSHTTGTFPNHDSKYELGEVAALVDQLRSLEGFRSKLFYPGGVKTRPIGMPDSIWRLAEVWEGAEILIEKGIHQRRTDPHILIRINWIDMSKDNNPECNLAYHVELSADLTGLPADNFRWKTVGVSCKPNGSVGVRECWPCQFIQTANPPTPLANANAGPGPGRRNSIRFYLSKSLTE